MVKVAVVTGSNKGKQIMDWLLLDRHHNIVFCFYATKQNYFNPLNLAIFRLCGLGYEK